MNSSLNLTAALISNGLGILLILVLQSGLFWRLHYRSKENMMLMCMFVTILISCICDPLVFIADGRPELVWIIINRLGNTWLYAANLFMGYFWVVYLNLHLNGYISNRHRLCLLGCTIPPAVLLIVNFFYPIVFYIDSGNVYERRSMFWIYVAIFGCYLLDSIIMYIISSINGGMLKFFPLWNFLFPIALGAMAQSMMYGISVIWPCLAVSIAGLMTSLQNEAIFRDRLTGLYNRFYLDDLKTKLTSDDSAQLTALMLDLNRFKLINDQYGHVEGDRALIATSEVLTEVIGTLGTVIRYAGDEFIILMNTQDSKIIEACISTIKQKLEEYNHLSGKPYQLSASIGSSAINLASYSIDEIMNEIDHRMYEDKRAYYQTHANAERRADRLSQ